MNDVTMKPLAERMAALNEGAPIFLDRTILHQQVFPQILYTCLALWVVFLIAVVAVERILSLTGVMARRKAAYQLTNFCANLILSAAGFYFEYLVLPKNATNEEMATGFESVLFMSTFQLGYQLWAIPVGLFLVQESTQMLIHHVTVIIVSSTTAFLYNGFRYHSCFFYGIIELSSLPLAIMNFFKDNPALQKKYPEVNKHMRVTFAVTFLQVRIFMYMPRVYVFLRDHYYVWSTHPIWWYRLFNATVTVSSVVLLLMQLYWGMLVSKGLLKQVIAPRAKTA